ncbi:MAU2 chromatid cohesion factor homolog [Lingula anatina]|uniref:MAU2 chromatid cohesion factor homolog n=1 Tax=Lingula anatina TaxID=7574 RepID=A0A1S3J443_LINAN|nr:MAU2 chromatid cohesion factor homolog [Lingula anatina]|eukprot:XP_013405150.1 MAU2 chromatid cohesion factor homolog [Lingula anatina]
MATASQPEPCYLPLLGIAESFRTSNPPNIKLCIHCLQAILNLKPPPRIEARTRLQLGGLLFTHTKNIDLARSHLETAWGLSNSIPSFDDVKFEAASTLGQLYEQQSQVHAAKPVLRKAIEISSDAPYWRCRLLFQLAQIHVQEKDFVSAVGLLGVGADFAQRMGAQYSRVLYLLSRGMLLLISKNLTEVHQSLSLSGELIERLQGDPGRKEGLKVFFLILQVCHFLMAGQVKSVKPALKQLQQSIQTITSIHIDESEHIDQDPLPANPADCFQWLPKEHMCVLVYLVTVMHSMQAGYMDKAQKYTDKALMQIEKLKMLDSNPLLSSFQLMLLEHIIMCRLVMGNKTMAIQEISQACQVCQQSPKLLQVHGAQLHTLLGLYAMSMNSMDAAEVQFSTAIRLSTEPNLWSFNNLNLAIVYLRNNRHADLMTLLDRIDPERIPAGSHSLKAAAFYVRGLQSFFQARYNEAKRYLRETLKMANAEDLNRLTSCSLVLLGHIFLSLGNSEEAMNMVTPAIQLAAKIPDAQVQLWASALLRDLYRLVGDHEREAAEHQVHHSFSQSLLTDHMQSANQPEHKLMQWTEGPCPFHLLNSPNSSGPLL